MDRSFSKILWQVIRAKKKLMTLVIENWISTMSNNKCNGQFHMNGFLSVTQLCEKSMRWKLTGVHACSKEGEEGVSWWRQGLLRTCPQGMWRQSLDSSGTVPPATGGVVNVAYVIVTEVNAPFCCHTVCFRSSLGPCAPRQPHHMARREYFRIAHSCVGL